MCIDTHELESCGFEAARDTIYHTNHDVMLLLIFKFCLVLLTTVKGDVLTGSGCSDVGSLRAALYRQHLLNDVSI